MLIPSTRGKGQREDDDETARPFGDPPPKCRAEVDVEGGEAVVIPAGAGPQEIAKLVTNCEGVLLPGSPADVDPRSRDQRFLGVYVVMPEHAVR